MAINTTCEELRRFFDDKAFWPDDNGETYCDDMYLLVRNEKTWEEVIDIDAVEDCAAVKIDGGYVCGPQFNHGMGPSLESYFKKWKKKRSTETFVVSCNKEDFTAIHEAIKSLGGKIVR
jgi:hypothetical protein